MKKHSVLLSWVIFSLFFACIPVLADQAAALTDGKTARDFMNAGKALIDEGQIEKARQQFEQAIALDEGVAAEAYFSIGMAYSMTNRMDLAVTELEKAAQRKPEEVLIRFNLANAYRATGKNKKAIEQYRDIVDLKPDLFWAHYNLATLLKAVDEKDAAIDHMKKAIALNPKMPLLHYELGNIYDQFKMTDEAIALDPKNSKAFYQRGNQYLRKGRFDAAKQDFNAAIAIKPNYAEAHINLGAIEMYRKNPESAIPLLQKGLEFNPKLLPGLVNLSVAYRDTEQYDKALVYAQKAEDLGSKKAPSIKASIYRRLAKE